MSEAMKWTLKITKYEDYHLNNLGVDELKYLNAKECFAETEARRIAYETIEKLIDEYPNHDDRWLEGFEITITSQLGRNRSSPRMRYQKLGVKTCEENGKMTKNRGGRACLFRARRRMGR